MLSLIFLIWHQSINHLQPFFLVTLITNLLMFPVTSPYLAILLFLLMPSLISVSLVLKPNKISFSIFFYHQSLTQCSLWSSVCSTRRCFFCFLPPSNAAISSRVSFLSKSLVPVVLRTYHDHPLSEHFGVHRMLTRILNGFWWSSMRQSVQNYIASCTKRVCHNIICTKLDGHLEFLSVLFAAFQIVHMYFSSPIRVLSPRGNRYVIMLTDSFSRYVIADVSPNCSAKSAVSFFINSFILIRGAFERLGTDNGTHFGNHLD